MNRRDYFAAAALQGMLTQGRSAGLAERAYEIADKMCAEADKALDEYFKASRAIDSAPPAETAERERYRVALYRPKTPRVRAMSWTGTPEARAAIIRAMLPTNCRTLQRDDNALCVTDGATTHVINIGDWVVRYPHGEYSILTRQQFEDGFTPD